jgi:hypothetical protein
MPNVRPDLVNVVLYLCEGQYAGPGVLTFSAPEIGAHHKFLLVLRQVDGTVSYSAATTEAVRFGFTTVTVLNGRPLDVEALNSMVGFTKHYEEALSEGSSLLWYPNSNAQA